MKTKPVSRAFVILISTGFLGMGGQVLFDELTKVRTEAETAGLALVRSRHTDIADKLNIQHPFHRGWWQEIFDAHAEEPMFDSFVALALQRDSCAMVFEGTDAIERLTEIREAIAHPYAALGAFDAIKVFWNGTRRHPTPTLLFHIAEAKDTDRQIELLENPEKAKPSLL